MNKARKILDLFEYNKGRLLQNAKDGMIYSMDYWNTQGGGWDAYVKFWTEYDPQVTAEMKKEGHGLNAIADEISNNAALSYLDNTMKEFGISEDKVWKLVRDAIFKEGEFSK